MQHAKIREIKHAYQRWMNSSDYSLRDVYKSHSWRKEHAFDYCRTLCRDYDGAELRIISYNSNIFTCGFVGVVDGKKAFVYITPSYDRYAYLEELED